TPEQAELAKRVPVAQDLTAEADSGGHTDNRPLVALLPTLLALRDRMQSQHGYDVPLRVGAAGGLATPAGVVAAFAMGAAYVLTGSINQACVESGSSDAVRKMLAEAGQADVIMAPAADMFEMGVKVQVLKRGTLFAMRAAKLYELYRTCANLEAIPAAERVRLEKDLFRAPLEAIWAETRQFWLGRDPKQVERGETDGRHKMALTFRWYLGLSSRWANAGEPTRQGDYQVWCGPAMGAFNDWANIKAKVDGIGPVPATHWNPDDYFDADPKRPDRTYARRGGFLDPFPFPPAAFGIAPNDLEATDTSQLLALVVAQKALEDAGLTADRSARKVSVILGVTGTLELVVPLGARLGHPVWRKALHEAGISDEVAEDVVKRI